MKYERAYRKLESYGQLHVLKYYDSLTQEEKDQLLDQILDTDFEVLQYCKNNTTNRKGKISPLTAMTLDAIDRERDRYLEAGLAEIRAGKVAAVMLAGGMGTRLGSEEPKGMYDIGETRPVYIFQRQIENMLEVVKVAGTWFYLFIMTSDKNHESTVRFFEDHDCFGYQREYIRFFTQDMVPASDPDGYVYMEEKGRMSVSPNGNGGWFSSMCRGGFLELLRSQGIEWLNVFAVDNVLQRIADPCFVGAVTVHGCVSGAKVVRKSCPEERVGVLCLEDGRPSIVEYYELTEEMKEKKDESGSPAYGFGVILNYLFRVSELECIMDGRLPWHVVKKVVPFLDGNGNRIRPSEPNGLKYETLVLDMIHQVKDCLPYEVEREREFAPIKNATGEDSVETARELCRKNGILL